jgi:hypothetical protein
MGHTNGSLKLTAKLLAGAVYGTNSVPVYVDDIENIMKDCTKLMGKPKILIIQACQGQTQQDGESDLQE